MSQIHPTAVIEQGAQVGKDVHIGPYCVVGSNVSLGDGVHIVSHVVISGTTTIGGGTRIFPFASIGHAPQDLKFKGETSRLEIGSNNVIREHVTLNPGTELGGMLTKVGDNCLLMTGAHIAHDCLVGNNVILANNATLGGHVEVGNYAVLGGLCAVHQQVRVGEHSIIGGLTGVESDVIPFGSAMGDRAALVGLNLIGLKRRDFPRKQIHELRQAYKMLFSKGGILKDRMKSVSKKFPKQPLVETLLDFMSQPSKRGLCIPK